jgi:hypothetical protein
VDAQNASTAPWKTLRTRFPQLPQTLFFFSLTREYERTNGTRSRTSRLSAHGRHRSAVRPPQPGFATQCVNTSGFGFSGVEVKSAMNLATQHKRSSKRLLALVDDDYTALQDDFGFQHVPVAFQRIAVEKDEIGQFARLQGSELIAHLDVRGGVRAHQLDDVLH